MRAAPKAGRARARSALAGQSKARTAY